MSIKFKFAVYLRLANLDIWHQIIWDVIEAKGNHAQTQQGINQDDPILCRYFMAAW